MSEIRRGLEKAAEKAKEAAAKAGEKLREVAEEAKERAEVAAAKAGELAKEAAEKAKEAVGRHRVSEEGDLVRVEVDMPGLEPSDISAHISPTGDRLSVRGQRGERRYDLSIQLPHRLDPSTVRAVYRHGVLQITGRKAPQAADIPIKVEG